MVRKAFKMNVFADKTADYRDRHNPVWSELKTVLKNHGVSNYSIFLDANSNSLFGYAEVDTEEQWNAIATTEICRKWWEFMSDCMETNQDNSPVSEDLKEIFHLD